jgi:hypothetical protein
MEHVLSLELTLPLHNQISDTDISEIKEVEREDSFLVQKWNGLILYKNLKGGGMHPVAL